MARVLGIKKKSTTIGYCVRGGYIFTNLGLGSFNILTAIRRLLRIRRDFLHYATAEYPLRREAFWKEHATLRNRLRDDSLSLEGTYLLFLDSLALFERWMLEQSISLVFLTFAILYLRLLVLPHFPVSHRMILSNLALGHVTVSDHERALLYRLGKLISRGTNWETLSGEAKQIAEELLNSAGFRAASYDFTEFTWEDRPALILEMAQSVAEAVEAPISQATRLRQMRETAELNLVRRLRITHCFSGEQMSKDVINLNQAIYPLKEDRQKQMAASWALVKQTVRRIGEALVKTGFLTIVEDVYFLTASELCGLVHLNLQGRTYFRTPTRREDIQAVIYARRETFRACIARPPPDEGTDVVVQLPWKPSVSMPFNQQVLLGKYSLPGHVVARAVVITKQSEFSKMKPGLILVAPRTNPNWDILFGIAAGIVTEYGGPTSHPMLKAAEYGIPAVIGVRGATKRIKDGDLIRLDGARREISWAISHA
jgi:phosphohistidine swiveling domain-containing protein